MRMLSKNNRRLAWALGLLSAVAIAQQTMPPVIVTAPPPPPTMPPVIATAPRISGGTAICRGFSCAGFIEAARDAHDKALQEWEAYTSQPPLEDFYVDDDQLCANIRADRPSGCNATSPPPSPGISIPGRPNWQPNGCGTGGIGDWFQDFILERVAGTSYSGTLNAPYAGVDFTNACNGHDQCWAEGRGRSTCDMSFRDNMNSACSQLSTTDAAAGCSGFASLYHGAVSTTDGSHSAYASSTANRACAVWANEMRENDCEN